MRPFLIHINAYYHFILSVYRDITLKFGIRGKAIPPPKKNDKRQNRKRESQNKEKCIKIKRALKGESFCFDLFLNITQVY